MTRVGIISQARMTSTRLPGKVLMSAGGATMLDHHVTRLRAAGLPILIATTTNATDDPVIAAAEALQVTHFRGSEQDVLGRFAGAADDAGLDVVVRVTSDCPLIDGDLIRRGVDRFLALDDDDAYVSNALVRTFPRGLDFEIFSAAALRDADARATLAADREHVTPYLNQNRSGRVTTYDVTRASDASGFRITLDTPEDLRAITTLIEDHDAATLDAEGLISLLETHPEIVALNASIEQKKLGQ